ncbi:ABC transporter ATP-binding protein [Ensifer adhaerens]|uniref:ABC transporter ATP-binding protein n=1 Tax=Ensifer adhaerens TaxID=106592 RepID=UPI001C4DFE8A|nr:ATP-binding cassette domain-containing protein [Ensifer adhaerens]MBW0368321.1 ATP-binding cassette domain-containing protein [Ensifer adhaerens]UCM24937.1 ATP-binding cassette domain-containing protein [Ensifer adhaerens]
MVSLQAIRVEVRDTPNDRRDILAIDELSFPPGELTVIAGPSGSGKSTLLNVISGITPATSGSVTVLGEKVTDFREGHSDAWRRRTVGMIFQDFNLIKELSPLANIRLPESFGKTARSAENAKSLMQRFGIPEDRSSVSGMSRGEQQRVAIARALLFDPPLILADEPTASLDTKNASFVIDAMIAEAAKGKTVIAVSHDPAFAARAATTIHLERGRLVRKDRAR